MSSSLMSRICHVTRLGFLGATTFRIGLLIWAGSSCGGSSVSAQVPFELQGPGVNPNHFRISRFADGLNFPVGMAALDDGSVIVATSNGNSFYNSRSGSLIRLADENADGVADTRQTLFDDVPGGLITTVRRAGDLLFVTGQGRAPISVFRLGEQPQAPVSLIGQLDIRYPIGDWLHPHSALAVRQTINEQPSGGVDQYELYFQVGSASNFETTRRQVTLSGTLGLNAEAAGDAIHRVTLTDDGTQLAATQITQIATGLRNAAGMAFHPRTGDFFLQDNGIDGLDDANEPESADELNRIAASRLGGEIEDFGFPHSYVKYRTGEVIGGEGIPPITAYQPIPDPLDGSEAEGPNDISFAPDAFPLPLRLGIFVTMHGKFSQGGLQNEENPLVFTDLRDGSYFHFIDNSADVGHLDGLLATADSLFISDFSQRGGLGPRDADSGVIYQVKSLLPTVDQLAHAIRTGASDLRFDLNDDQRITEDDRRELIRNIHQTQFGDANWDGSFNSSDLVAVFAAGEYEDTHRLNSGWETGDWNGDGEFSSSDLVFVFSEGGYDNDVAAVPEPATHGAILVGAVVLLWRKRT